MRHDHKDYAFYLGFALMAERARDNQKVCYWLRKALEVLA